MDKNKALESVNEIKELMEKSSKFVSLSGMTAVLAGMYALAGAFVAGGLLGSGSRKELIVIASAILAASVITACIPVSYTHLDVYKRQVQDLTLY